MIPVYAKFVFAMLPFISLFFFPWPFTLAAAFTAGLVFPPLAVALGVFADVLYFSSGVPLATLAGTALAIIAAGVRMFAKQRIMTS